MGRRAGLRRGEGDGGAAARGGERGCGAGRRTRGLQRGAAGKAAGEGGQGCGAERWTGGAAARGVGGMHADNHLIRRR